MRYITKEGVVVSSQQEANHLVATNAGQHLGRRDAEAAGDGSAQARKRRIWITLPGSGGERDRDTLLGRVAHDGRRLVGVEPHAILSEIGQVGVKLGELGSRKCGDREA
jgi:hypothetical protein